MHEEIVGIIIILIVLYFCIGFGAAFWYLDSESKKTRSTKFAAALFLFHPIILFILAVYGLVEFLLQIIKEIQNDFYK